MKLGDNCARCGCELKEGENIAPNYRMPLCMNCMRKKVEEINNG